MAVKQPKRNKVEVVEIQRVLIIIRNNKVKSLDNKRTPLTTINKYKILQMELPYSTDTPCHLKVWLKLLVRKMKNLKRMQV